MTRLVLAGRSLVGAGLFVGVVLAVMAFDNAELTTGYALALTACLALAVCGTVMLAIGWLANTLYWRIYASGARDTNGGPSTR